MECVIVDLSPEDEKELNIRLNANTGEFDWEVLNDWDKELLSEWGLDVQDFDYSDANKEIDTNCENDKFHFKLEYSEDEYLQLKELIEAKGKTPEAIFYEALVSV